MIRAKKFIAAIMSSISPAPERLRPIHLSVIHSLAQAGDCLEMADRFLLNLNRQTTICPW